MKKTKFMRALYAEEEKLYNKVVQNPDYNQFVTVQLLILQKRGKPKCNLLGQTQEEFDPFAVHK